MVREAVVSNRHCLLFAENKGSDAVTIVEDLSTNGTYVNEALVGRNQCRELEDHDEIAVHDKARFVFRYPKSRQMRSFKQQYTLLDKLGKGISPRSTCASTRPLGNAMPSRSSPVPAASRIPPRPRGSSRRLAS